MPDDARAIPSSQQELPFEQRQCLHHPPNHPRPGRLPVSSHQPRDQAARDQRLRSAVRLLVFPVVRRFGYGWSGVRLRPDGHHRRALRQDCPSGRLSQPLSSLDDARRNRRSVDLRHRHRSRADLGNVLRRPRSMLSFSVAESHAAAGLERLEIHTALRRPAGGLRVRLLEDPGGRPSPEKAGWSKPTTSGVQDCRGEIEQADGDERHQSNGPRVGEFRCLLRRHQSLHCSDELEGGPGNWIALRAVLCVCLWQSMSEPDQLMTLTLSLL